MKYSILDYFEDNVNKMPSKIAVEEKDNNITYKELCETSIALGRHLISKGIKKKNVVIYLDKGIQCVQAILGALYSANMYCILDVASPIERVKNICGTLCATAIVTSDKYLEKVRDSFTDYEIILANDVKYEVTDYKAIESVRNSVIDTDAVYALFTSGSTGVPKGTVVSHRSVISYIQSVSEAFSLDENVIFGNQTPFYFSMSVLDIFSTIILGATLVIVPKMYFSFPVKLIEYLNIKKVNTIYWVPTAMCIVANRDTFTAVVPQYLSAVLFAGEVMPVKQLNYWIKYLPECKFSNLYGPTEITDTGTYYTVNRKFEDYEQLPIGKPFRNCDVFILNSENKLAVGEEEGEICVRGSFLGAGYFNNIEKTKEVFCQNPLNSSYPEIIYRTGDIGKYNKYGEIEYISRKDFQIKRLGYRIELGEIESAVNALEKVDNCVCIYDSSSKKIVLFYVGRVNEESVKCAVEGNVPTYMYPDKICKVDNIPINPNGKFDRKLLISMIKGEEN